MLRTACSSRHCGSECCRWDDEGGAYPPASQHGPMSNAAQCTLCCRFGTAYHLSRVLLSMDPTHDPMGALQAIDYYAMRGGEVPPCSP